MDDRMLKHWGAAAARMCTPEANLGAPPRQVFVIQLAEAHAEWRRRHPQTARLVLPSRVSDSKIVCWLRLDNRSADLGFEGRPAEEEANQWSSRMTDRLN
jgi:hypothetical protein